METKPQIGMQVQFSKKEMEQRNISDPGHGTIVEVGDSGSFCMVIHANVRVLMNSLQSCPSCLRKFVCVLCVCVCVRARARVSGRMARAVSPGRAAVFDL